MLIKVTAISKSTNVSTISFDKPTAIAINPYKIVMATPIKENKTELLLDHCSLIITETPEQLLEIENAVND